MADEKKGGMVTLMNRGRRVYDHGFDEKKKERKHWPGSVMTYTAEEAKKFEGYKDLVDVSKLPGQVDVSAIKADNSSLKSENEKLKAELAALKTEEPKSKDPKVKDQK